MGGGCDYFLFYHLMSDSGFLFKHDTVKIKGTLLDVYARAGKVKKAEALFRQMSERGAFKYSIMIRAYAKSDRPEQATAILYQVLKNPKEVAPGENGAKKAMEHIFTGVIDAWAESSHPDAFARGETVFRLIESDVCRRLGVEHTQTTYGAMLKCVAKLWLKRKDSGERAEALLNEMEERNLTPNIMYVLPLHQLCYSFLKLTHLRSSTARSINSTVALRRQFALAIMHQISNEQRFSLPAWRRLVSHPVCELLVRFSCILPRLVHRKPPSAANRF